MSEFDPDGFYEQTGIDVRLATPSTEPALSSAGAQAQLELLRRLAGMRTAIEIMEALVRDYPNADHGFDALDRTLASDIAEAGAALTRFRDRRDCKGAA